MKNVKVVAVVVTYNRKELLKECLEAIMTQSYLPYATVVIDNNSNDGTYEMLCSEELIDKIVYKKLRQNIGGAGGFNAGMIAAQDLNPEWLWIMDDDTIPTKKCLQELIAAKEILEESGENKERSISFLASSVYGKTGECMNVPIISKKRNDNGYEYWYEYLSEGMIQIDRATFVSLLISEEAVKKVGFPYKDFFIWGDDSEYTSRLTQYYGEAYLVGRSVAIHKRKSAKNLDIKDDASDRLSLYYYFYRNRLIISKAYGGKKSVCKQTIVTVQKAMEILIGRQIKNKAKKIRIIIKGMLAYYFNRYDRKAFRNRMNTEYIDKQKQEYKIMLMKDVCELPV